MISWEQATYLVGIPTLGGALTMQGIVGHAKYFDLC